MRMQPFWRKKAAERGLPELQEQDVLRPRFLHRNPIMPGVLELITQGIYDYYEVAVATVVTSQILYSIPRGQQYTPAGGAAFTKQKYHTPLLQAGQLSAPQKLMVKGLSAYLRSDIAAGDYNLFSGNTLVTFQVDQKDYLNIVLAKLPGGGGPAGFFTSDVAAVTSSSIANGWPEANAIYALEGDGVQIEQQQNFTVIIDPTQVQAGAFTTLAAAGTTFGTGVKMIFTLEGLLSRAVL
jgi:hypothetical protein